MCRRIHGPDERMSVCVKYVLLSVSTFTPAPSRVHFIILSPTWTSACIFYAAKCISFCSVHKQVTPSQVGRVSEESCQILESLPTDQAELESIHPPREILDTHRAFPGLSSSDSQSSCPSLSSQPALQTIQRSTSHNDDTVSAAMV